MQLWQTQWLEIQKIFPTKGLVALKAALLSKDPALIDCFFALPENNNNVDAGWSESPCARGCAIGYTIWNGFDLVTCQEVSEKRYNILDDWSAMQDFVYWFDQSSPDERLELVPLIDEELKLRDDVQA